MQALGVSGVLIQVGLFLVVSRLSFERNKREVSV